MILGLTGGIATGKSTVSRYFIEKGFLVICADEIAKEIMEEKNILNEITKEFGEEMVLDGVLNRKKMREYVFMLESRVKKLNNITHPLIIEKIRNEIKKYKEEKLIIVDIPLLFEGNYEYLIDKVLLVSCKKEIQLQRVIKRDEVSNENAQNLIDKQLTLEEKESRADFIIQNNETIEELYKKIDDFLEKLKLPKV